MIKNQIDRANLLAFLFYNIKTLLAWILLRCASVVLYLDGDVHWRIHAKSIYVEICEISLNASKPCNNLQTFKTIYKIS